MSRRIVIEGSVTVEVSELAEEVAAEMRREGARESLSATTELPGFSIFALCVLARGVSPALSAPVAL